MIAMNERTMRAVALLSDMETMGATVPSPVQDAVETYEERQTKLATMVSAAESERYVTTVESILDGRMPPTKDVLAMLVADSLSRRPVDANIVKGGLDDHLTNAVRENGAAIVEAMRPVFDAAARTLTEAFKVLGNIKLTDLEAVANTGGNAAQMWGEAKAAEQQLHLIRSCLVRMHQMDAYPAGRYTALLLTDVDLTGYQQLPEADNATPWDIVRTGYALSLPTAEEYVQRCDRLDAEWRASREYESTRRFDSNAVTHANRATW